MVENTQISDKQLLAIPHILNSRTVDEACQKIGISRPSYYAWIKDEKFKSELTRQRNEVVGEAVNYLKCTFAKAVEELGKFLDSPKPELRRLACKDIIDYTLKSMELENIEERLDKVERVVLLEKKTYHR